MASWWTQPNADLRIGGHRGASADAPENTLAGFRRAIAAGADYVECDVRLTFDGELVVIHDDELERTTDGTGRVAATTADRVCGLDAGSWFGPTHAGERVPRLTDVLALVEAALDRGMQVGAVMEAKGPGTGGPLARRLGASAVRDRLAICSFAPEELLAARAADPAVPTMLIVDRERPQDDPLNGARACGADLVNVPVAWLTAEDVARLHAGGLRVAGGTADDELTVRRALELGLDAVDSNVPDRAVAWRTAARALR